MLLVGLTGGIGAGKSTVARMLARRVFSDPEARRRLEAITHPEVARLLAAAIAPLRDTDRVVVYAVPLLVENRLEQGFDVVVVVSAPEGLRVARAAAERGMTEDAVRERLAAQASDEMRERVAHHVIRNDGSLEAVEREVDKLWSELSRRS